MMDIKFLLGLIEGEGCFSNNITWQTHNNKKYPVKCVQFKIGMHVRDIKLMEKVKDLLKMGSTKLSKADCRYVISNRLDLSKLIKIIDKNGGFEGHKNIQYEIWKNSEW